MVQECRKATIMGKKKELKTKCNYVMYSVKSDPLLPKWFDVVNLNNKHEHMVRLSEIEGQLTCTCEWGTHCINSGEFDIECWHVKAVREMLKNGK